MAKRSNAQPETTTPRIRVKELRFVRAGDILPNPRNWREHPPEQIEAYKAIVESIGIAGALLTRETEDGRLMMYDGHMRQDVDPDLIYPALVTDLTEDESEQALLTFDPLAAMAQTNAAKLEALMQRNTSDRPEIQRMMAELAERAGLYQDEGQSQGDPGAQLDRAGELKEKWQVERGQLWSIPSKSGNGCHKLLCGDSTNADDVARVMGGERAQGVFTSPPYAEQRKHQYGGTPADEYVEWWEGIQANVRNHICDDGSFFVNIKPHCDNGERVLYVMDLVLAMCREWNWKLVDEFSWLHEDLPGAWPNRFRNGFEPVYQFSLQTQIKFHPRGVAHPSASVPNGRGGMQKSDGGNWTLDAPLVKGMAQPSNVLKIGGNTESVNHSAAFPVALPDFFIRAYSDTGDIWFEPFGGSGTTMVASEQLARQCRMIEIEPKYCAVILERMFQLTGERPVLSSLE